MSTNILILKTPNRKKNTKELYYEFWLQVTVTYSITANSNDIEVSLSNSLDNLELDLVFRTPKWSILIKDYSHQMRELH